MNSSVISSSSNPTANQRKSLPEPRLEQYARPSMFQKLARDRFVNALSNFEYGAIEFDDGVVRNVFGQNESINSTAPAILTVNDPAFYIELALGGNLGFAESYLQGHWQTNDLTKLLTTMYRNVQPTSTASTFVAAIRKWFDRLRIAIDRNTLSGSKRHIAAHYDLGNEFFELFLDPTLMYSSGWFADENTTLHEASIAKLNQICNKLQFKPGESVLEIGTGWGGFALHAANHHDIEITTTTISAAQATKAKQRINDADLVDRVQILETDYRQLSGQFDKIVSIEMVEAVGETYLDTYFQQCGKLLRPGGRFAIQAIVMPEQRYANYRRNIDIIQKYIFPGGFLPSISAIQSSVGRTTGLRLLEIEDMSTHYARTLQQWRLRFMSKLDDVKQLGFDDRFIRMWEYYLCYCEAAFREQAVRVVQIVWEQPHLQEN